MRVQASHKNNALAIPAGAPNDLPVSRPPLKSSRAPAVAPGQNPLAGAAPEATPTNPLKNVFSDDRHGVWLYQGNSLEVLDALIARYRDGVFDMIFADPPYFLSNGGITCHAGKMVKVDKGEWDKSRGPELNHEFNTEWLRRCQRVLKPNGTLWVSGTQHVIFSVGYAMQQLGFKILNDIAWEKPNPPPNLSCRYFTHSTETILWAARNEKSKHYFNYPLMRQIAGGKQMKSVWRMTSPRTEEKKHGKHPTQKPVALIERCILASTREGDLVLDPFLGGDTTAVAAMRTKRKCVGIELEEDNLTLAARRLDHERHLFVNPSPNGSEAAWPDAHSRSPMATS
jgi:site-specific DNA-methyltransferase (adenine-specific)